jgi:hypothetical protein
LLERTGMSAYLPSLSALESLDDDRLAAELRLARVRSQAAVVRALADHAEHLGLTADIEAVGEQLIEETARLRCRILELAGSPSSPRVVPNESPRRRDVERFASTKNDGLPQ